MSLVVANILDPIHDTLSPDVWDNPGSPRPKLKEQHRKWISATVVRALNDAGYTHVEGWLTLVLTGSLTTYQYDVHSDCDVSLFVDAEVFPEWSRAEMIGIMTSKVDGTILPGTSYPMQCYVVPPEIKQKDLYRPGLRSGYDLDKDSWIEPPDRSRNHDVQREMNALYVYAEEQADKMESLLRYEPDKAKMFWRQIHRRRQRDQRAGKGDYALSNIVYKYLANRGLFPELADLTGEYIAKTALQQDRQVAKFVYDPVDNRLIVGKMGAEEGEVESHNDLMSTAGIAMDHGPLFGQISANGYIETFGRPMITGFGASPMNQYEADWRLQKALKIAFPEAQFTGVQSDVVNPHWEQEWTEPTITYLGEKPTIHHDSLQPAPEEGVWAF